MASNFEFYSPTRVIFGKGTEQRVGALVREYGGTRVLIVYGGKSAVRSGVLDRAEKSLAEAGISSWTLGGVVPNPHLDKVYEGIRIGKENSIDFLLAVGGGSVIDTAKAIAYGLAEPEKDVWELYEHTRTARKCLPVASILTIAAAGSETSNSSVITRVDTHQKRAYNDDISRPKFALMDPELTKTLPDYQTESGCADIMMHTMERYFTNGGNMELTDALAEGLLRTVMKNALILHTDPANYEARAEVGNDAPACLVSTSLIKLGLSAVLCIIFWFTAVQWSRWLLQEYRGEAFWQSAWPLPTIYAAFLVFCMPLDPAVVLINRLMIISVLAVSISLLGIFLLLYEMYQVAREYTRSAQLDRENQLLAVESRRYTELRAYMEQTRHLRHDFRQHLHVIAGLTEAGQVDELKNYLHQYESELSEERPTLCANPAVDALAGHYDHEAHSLGVPVDWRLELPRQLAIPETDFCMMLGNLLENAFHASQKLPPEQGR